MGRKPKAKKCEAMAGLLKEADELAEEKEADRKLSGIAVRQANRKAAEPCPEKPPSRGRPAGVAR